MTPPSLQPVSESMTGGGGGLGLGEGGGGRGGGGRDGGGGGDHGLWQMILVYFDGGVIWNENVLFGSRLQLGLRSFPSPSFPPGVQCGAGVSSSMWNLIIAPLPGLLGITL